MNKYTSSYIYEVMNKVSTLTSLFWIRYLMKTYDKIAILCQPMNDWMIPNYLLCQCFCNNLVHLLFDLS